MFVISPESMIIRCFVFILVSVTASFVFGNTSTPPQEVSLVPTRNNFFTIPFEIKVDDLREMPTEVELTYSSDHGMNWFPYGRVRPENKQFLFRAPTDGEYWFIFKTYGQDGLVKEPRRRGPMLRVLVDTIPPKLTLDAEQKSTGEILIQWSVEDPNLARKTPQLQITYSIPNQKKHYLANWKPIAVNPLNTQSEGNKHQGELVIWPEYGAVALEIQAEIIDMAGNREMQSRTVSLAVVTKGEDSNVLTESMQSTFKSIPKATPSPAYASAEPVTAQATKPLTLLNPPRPPIQSVQPVQSSQNRPLPPPTIASLDEINHSLKSINPTQSNGPGTLDFDNLTLGAESVVATPGKDSVLVGPILFLEDVTDGSSLAIGSPQTPIAMESRANRETLEFMLENKMEDEIDDGPVWSIPNPKPSPLNFNFDDSPLALDDELEEEGVTETATSEPVAQANTTLRISENSNAFIRITKISHLRDLKLNQILVKWETDENSWTGSEEVKVHIFRGPSQKGPWTPIAVDQKNTGSYVWDISQEDRNPFYILLQCEGETGENQKELVSDLTMQPIQLPVSLFK